MRVLMVVLALLCGASAHADWVEPARGSADRGAIMDALRPHAEWQLGAPVEFVVQELRRSGDMAFGAVVAQRPGGVAIDLTRTPGFRRGEIDVELSDGTTMQALLVKSGQTWVAVHWAIGATDVWFAWDEICRAYRPVIADFCQGVD